MADAVDPVHTRAAGRPGTSWLVVGLQRGAALAVLYGVALIAGGWVADRVSGAETGVVTLGVLVVVLGVPFGVAGGALIGAICALVDRRSGWRHPRRTVAVRVLGTIGAVTALGAAAALEYWAFFVGVPCTLGLVSLWAWPIPERRIPPPAASRR